MLNPSQPDVAYLYPLKTSEKPLKGCKGLTEVLEHQNIFCQWSLSVPLGKIKKEYNDIKVIFGDVTKPAQGSI